MSELNNVYEYIVPAVGQRITRYSEPVVCGPLRELVIRCRDCKHFEDVMGAFECEQSSGEPHHAEPDGFCSWAEPKEE
mgnify:CR=1 FL=1